jgi:outer membrane protein
MKQLLLIPSLVLSLHAEAVLYTVDTLIEKALLSSPDLNISRSSVEISKQQTKQAVSDYLPQVDLYGGIGQTGIKTDGSQEKSSLLTGQVTASQLIYDFGKTGGQIDYYAEESNASYARYNQEISNKIYKVKKDYYDLLRKESLIKVYEENLVLTQQQLIRAQRYFTAGIKTKIDVVDAKVRLIQAQLDLENSHYDRKLAYVTLDRSVGNIRQTVEGNLYLPDLNITGDLYGSLPKESMSLDALVDFAYRHRYELKSYDHKIKSAQNRVRQESGDYYPGFYLGGNYQYSDVESDIQAYVPEQQWNANVNLKWNLFGGLRTTARTQQAKLALLQSRSSYDDAKLRIRQEASNAGIFLLKRVANVKLSQELSEAAKDKFEQARKRYENGLSDYIELQEARQGYINANAALVSNYYDYFISLAALDRAIGR